MKTLLVRYDIDNCADWEKGIPSVVSLLDALSIKATFFLNVGQAFDFKSSLLKFFKTEKQSKTADKISLFTKMGLGSIIKTVLLNPHLISLKPPLGNELIQAGHELALHGGTNHAIWQSQLTELSKKALSELFLPAYKIFSSTFGAPKGFSSPGFAYNKFVLELIEEYNFSYAVDMQASKPFRPKLNNSECSHIQIPATTASKHGVPFIEQQLSKNQSYTEIIKSLLQRINNSDFAVYYSHPSLDALHLPLIADLFKQVRSKGWTILTHAEYADEFKKNL